MLVLKAVLVVPAVVLWGTALSKDAVDFLAMTTS